MKRLFSILCALMLLLSCAACAEDYILLKGDLHCHSKFSHDSDTPYEQVMAESKIAGYDFIALTEHNTTNHLKNDLSSEDMIVLPAMELTMRCGHFNVFGLRSFQYKTDLIEVELADYIKYCREIGMLIQMNHPNVSLYYSRYEYRPDVDMIELLNGRVTGDDLKTLADYQTLLTEGRRLIATCGTDAHKNYTSRRAYNCVYAAARTPEAILEAIAAGRLYINVAADGPVIQLTCGDYVMGQTKPREAGDEVTISLSGVPILSNVRVYTSEGLVQNQSVKGDATLTVPVGNAAFVRCEIWQSGSPIAISNPLYFE